MNRQESFERHYAEMHDVPADTMAQYRWANQDGYRLPQIASAYRNYCAGWDAHPQNIHRPLLRHQCLACGKREGHGGLPCPKYNAESITITGVPYSD